MGNFFPSAIKQIKADTGRLVYKQCSDATYVANNIISQNNYTTRAFFLSLAADCTPPRFALVGVNSSLRLLSVNLTKLADKRGGSPQNLTTSWT